MQIILKPLGISQVKENTLFLIGYNLLLKKIFSILLLAVHLFNLCGYSFLFQFLIQQSDKQLTQNLDNNLYSRTDLVEVKIPLNLPYQTNWNEYERFDGNINFDGIHYNYVMRKVCNDTLYILCIPNHKKTQLYNAQSNYQKLVNDIPSNKKSGDNDLKKRGVLDEYNLPAQYCFNVNATLVTMPGFITSSNLQDCFIPTSDQPPEV